MYTTQIKNKKIINQSLGNKSLDYLLYLVNDRLSSDINARNQYLVTLWYYFKDMLHSTDATIKQFIQDIQDTDTHFSVSLIKENIPWYILSDEFSCIAIKIDILDDDDYINCTYLIQILDDYSSADCDNCYRNEYGELACKKWDDMCDEHVNNNPNETLDEFDTWILNNDPYGCPYNHNHDEECPFPEYIIYLNRIMCLPCPKELIANHNNCTMQDNIKNMLKEDVSSQ